jgi:hypothetical protein
MDERPLGPDQIRLMDVPRPVLEAAAIRQSHFTVGFVAHGKSGQPKLQLLGSGVLVVAGKQHAILTAHHVWQILPRDGRLGLFLESTDHPPTIDTKGLGFVEIARGTDETLGPDLAAILLAVPIAATIGAKKSFVDLDRFRETLLGEPIDIHDGFWLEQGFLDERTTHHVDETVGAVVVGLHLYDGWGQPYEVQTRGDYDYLAFPVTGSGRDEMPKTHGGMSGGPVWQVPFGRKDDAIEAGAGVLSGVIFYQRPVQDECRVVAHGRRSVYGPAYEAIRGS